VEASGERAGGGGEVERYERLRACALGGDPDGHRFGLALLERRGVAAWARAWQTTMPAPSPPPARPALGPTPDARELVGVLATMALACLAGR
jgi:hypothetical protein